MSRGAELSGRLFLSRHGKRQVGVSMYTKGEAFIGAAILLRRQDNLEQTDHVVLHLRERLRHFGRPTNGGQELNGMTNNERSDLAVLTVQTLVRLRGIAKALEARGHQSGDVDREIRDSIAAVAPAIRESLRLEMTSDEITRLYRTRFPGHERRMSEYGSRHDRRSWRHWAIAFQG
jgi:hypothetical protein